MKLMHASKYSSIVRLIRVTAYVLRFVSNIKKRVQHLEPTLVVLPMKKLTVRNEMD